MDRPPEHHEALALLAAEAERARAGVGRLVVLRGATGTGRTSVLEAAAEDAAAAGMCVLRARCSPGDAGVPFAAARQLLGAGAEFDTAAGERAGGARLWQALLGCAGQAPLLLAVDDVHLADAASHRWLVETARQVGRSALPVLLAVTERSQYDVDPRTPAFTHTLSPALHRTHTLAPLTAGSAARLVRAVFPDAPPPWVDACLRASAGNPLLLHALLDDLAAGPHPTVPASTAALYPGAYPEAVSWWLDSAGPATAEVARALAVLDEGWEERERSAARSASARGAAAAPGGRDGELAASLAGSVGADAPRVAGWLTAMTGLGVLRPDPAGRLRYAHPLLRDAVLIGVPAERRIAVHRQTAELMLHRGTPTEVARQLLLTGPVGRAWASAALQDAASLALREDRTDDAVTFLRQALHEPLSDDERRRLLTDLGSLEYAGRQTSRSIGHLREAMGLAGAPQERVRTAVALGTALAGHGRTRAAVDVLRILQGQLTDHPDLVRTLHTASALISDQDLAVRREVYHRLCATGDHAPDLVGTACRALLVRYAATAGLTSAQDAMRQIRALLAEPADPLAEPFLIGTAAAVAQWADELPEADRLVERGLAGQGPDLLHPMHDALLDTRADIAGARADHAALLALPLPQTTVPTNRHAHALIALVDTCRPAEARRIADGFDLRDAPENWALNRFLFARGVLRAATGDPAAALHDFLECGRRQSARHVISPVVTPWRTAAAECRLALGLPHEAIVLAEEELRLARVWNTPRTVARALRVLGTATGGRRGVDLTEEAVRLLRDAPHGSGTGPDLTAALIAYGRQLAAAGDRTRAREAVREAAELAERLPAPRLRGQAHDALRATGARRTAAPRTGSAALTTSERRIAELAAAGRTNAEIAALLHLAQRTVETHLTSTYKKLAIRRRSDLPAALAGG